MKPETVKSIAVKLDELAQLYEQAAHEEMRNGSPYEVYALIKESMFHRNKASTVYRRYDLKR